MRRVFLTLVALVFMGAGLAVQPAPAFAGDRHDRYERRGDLGYWERPGDRRRWNRHSHRRHKPRGVHYYPGYGYYADARGGHGGGHHGGHGGYDGHGRDQARSQWCASRYRSYDWRTGTYVTYDGRRRYCG